jgi:cell volume regulation protein A
MDSLNVDLSLEHMLLAGSLLMLASVLLSQASNRTGIPTLLLFLLVGMLAGSDGPGGIHFDDPELVQFLGMTSLVMILYAGGFDTKWDAVKPALGRGLSLATLGVVLAVAAFGVLGVFVAELDWRQALLFGAIISSTDAAAVFGVMRARAEPLRGRVGEILEVESGCNDPMAVFLTLSLMDMASGPEDAPFLGLIGGFFWEMGLGAVMGLVAGGVGAKLVGRPLSIRGLQPTLSIAIALLTFSATSLLEGSGFLAVYLAGLVMGNAEYDHRESLTSFHDGLAWLAQVVMFLSLGLLVFPSRLTPVLVDGIAVALLVMFVVRPLSVFGALAFSASDFREKLLISWAGLRGAVPIMLATLLLVDHTPLADRGFHLVFFVVVFSVLLQGTTIPLVARWLRL